MESAIIFKEVYKEYPFYQHITAGFKSFLFNLPKNLASLKRTKFVALNHVSFDIKKGETLGIIGKNGSGKSTILSLMAGVIKADRGAVKTYGKISSLLELGAGFHPDLSGVENIILNGVLMGNTKEEVLRKLDRIVEFSELGDFVYQPLRTYSSGMQVRLGFSVASHIDPEVLLIDEALAVGDLSFQSKCMKKMTEFRESGATIVLVSHDMSSIAKLCDRALWIDEGSIAAMGKPKGVIMKYLDASEQRVSFSGDNVEREEAGGPDAFSQAAGAAEGLAAGQGPLPGPGSASEGLEGKEKGDDHAIVRRFLPPEPLSWWDSPAIIKLCSDRVTGDSEVSLYDLMERRYMIASLDKGLSFCCRLEGLETDFMINNVCKSFDVVDDEGTVGHMVSGTWKGKTESYDFLLCVDFLHRLESPGFFLRNIAHALKDGAVLLAIEYIGPAGFRRPEKEIEIAKMVLALLGSNAESPGPSGAPARDFRGILSDGAVGAAQLLPGVREYFEVLDIRYFAGPLFDLVIDRVLCGVIPVDKMGSPEAKRIENIIRLDELLIKEGVIENNYGIVVAKKKRSAGLLQTVERVS